MATYILNEERVCEKINKLVKDRDNKLHVITDFDRTLTIGDKKANSSWGAVRNEKSLGRDYLRKTSELFDKYYPIETSSSIPLKEKAKHMEDWWQKHGKLLIEKGLSIESVKRAAKNIKLRKGALEAIRLLNKRNVPLLIFSAGIGNIIKEFLDINNLNTPNVHMVANFFEFGKDGKASNYTDAVIHTFNKNEGVVKSKDYHAQVEQRKNVILLGDTVADTTMSDGINHEVVLKIGFLNGKNKLEEFKEAYDIVIEDDSMEYVECIINKISEIE